MTFILQKELEKNLFTWEKVNVEESLQTTVDISQEYVGIFIDIVEGFSYDLQLSFDKLIVAKEHTFEEKFQRTEEGLRTYMWEEEYLEVWIDFKYYGRKYYYKGLKRVNFTLKYTKPSVVVKKQAENFEGLYARLVSEMYALKGINLERGYVASTNIFDSTYYPVVSDVAKEFMEEKEWKEIETSRKGKIYRWFIQICLLRIFLACTRVLNATESMNTEAKFEVVRDWAHKSLDNSIKQHLVRKLPKMLKEVHAGFDTEYVPVDWGINDLVSGQLSITGLIKLVIPIFEGYKFEGSNTLTGENYIKDGPSMKNKDSVLVHINDLLYEFRGIEFGDHDRTMTGLCNDLLRLPGLDICSRTNKGYLFQFNKLNISNLLILGAAGEKLVLNFNTIINLINQRIDARLEEYASNLISLIDIGDCTLNIKTKVNESWKAEEMHSNSLPLETLYMSNELNSDLSHDPEYEVRRRLRSTEFGTLSVNKNIYLYGHYNAADLSMLKDWRYVSRNNVDILKKSFCSLVKPIKACSERVYIRDTWLLASAVANSLEAVGKAHGMSKGKVPQHYLEDMSLYLQEQPSSFAAYAMQDSLITLAHALFIVDFTSKLGRASVPSTLGSLSSTYSRNKWQEDNYRGYQINHEFPLGASQQSINPKGLQSLGIVGDNLNMFTGSFRGGRNECFKYGIDKSTTWYDYDLTSCYSTIMSMCGDPMYSQEVSGESLIDSGYDIGSGALASAPAPDIIPDLGNYISVDKDLRGTSRDFSRLDNSAAGSMMGASFAVSPKEASKKSIIKKYFVNKPKVTPNAIAPAPLPSPKPATSPVKAIQKPIKPIIKKDIVQEIDPSNLPASKPLLESEILHELMLEESFEEMWTPVITAKKPSLNRKYTTLSHKTTKNGAVPSPTITIAAETPTIETSEEESLAQLTPDIASLLVNPDYNKLVYLNKFTDLEKIDFTKGYSAVRVKFNLPDSIKYPPVPVTLDQTITIYPLKGESLITGLEFKSALNILKQHDHDFKHYIKIIHGLYIPFKEKFLPEEEKWVFDYKPFFDIINELQANRRKHPKKSAMERIWKDLGNMLYGKVVCGISNKTSLDARTNLMKSMVGSEITNPIIGTWITGFVRALITELLNATHAIGGRICSATTDGFVTDIPNLEEKLLKYFEKIGYKDSFLARYRHIRFLLSGDPSALEIKTTVKGLIQWTTRGQHSIIAPNNVHIAAMTGFQKHQFTAKELIVMLENALEKGNSLLFLQKRLTGALENYKDEKQVSMTSGLRDFRTVFDSKRKIINSTAPILDTAPFKDLDEARLNRTLMNTLRTGIYSDKYSLPNTLAANTATTDFLNYIMIFFKKYNLLQILDVLLLINQVLPKPLELKVLLKRWYACQHIKGDILSKLVSYKNNRVLVTNLYNLLASAEFTHNTSILADYRSKFSNFALPSLALVNTKSSLVQQNLNNVLSALNKVPKEFRKEILLRLIEEQ